MSDLNLQELHMDDLPWADLDEVFALGSLCS
jgi:hypothetical protein